MAQGEGQKGNAPTRGEPYNEGHKVVFLHPYVAKAFLTKSEPTLYRNRVQRLTPGLRSIRNAERVSVLQPLRKETQPDEKVQRSQDRHCEDRRRGIPLVDVHRVAFLR